MRIRRIMNQTCINEAKNLKLSDPELSTDRDVLTGCPKKNAR